MSLSSAFTKFYKFREVVFSFLFTSTILKFLLRFPPLTNVLLRSVLLNLCIFRTFPAFSYRFPVYSIVIWQETLYYFYSFNLLRCSLWPRMWSILAHMSLERMYILLMLDEVLYRCELLTADLRSLKVYIVWLPRQLSGKESMRECRSHRRCRFDI